MRILLVDDQPIVRLGLRTLLEAHGCRICGEATSGTGALVKARRLKPDVVIMDASNAGDGARATRQIRASLPRTEILIFSVNGFPQIVRSLLTAGARGCVSKLETTSRVVAAVNALGRHKPFFSRTMATLALDREAKRRNGDPPPAQLTDRQREIVRLLADGKTNKECALALGVSRKTVETHRLHIMKKLQLGSFSNLVRWSIRTGLVDP